MAEEKDSRPGWMEEFQRVNAQAAYPLTPPPLQAAGGGKAAGNRRQHARFDVDGAPAVLRPQGIINVIFNRQNIGREALDLSEGGARLVAVRRVPPGSLVQVRILFGKFQDEIASGGEIRWCRQRSPSTEEFLLGLMFKDRDPERDRKIVMMRGYFTSPQFLAALEKRVKESSSDLLMRK
jgi:hypothetical protein